MRASVTTVVIFAIVAIIAVAYGYCVGIGQGCLRIGKAISGTKTGLQDAVSPPILAKIMIALNVAFIALVVLAVWRAGIVVALVALAGAFVIFGVGTCVAPKPTSPFYVRLTRRSLVRRAASYAKDNDHLRADAAFWCLKQIEERFGDELEG